MTVVTLGVAISLGAIITAILTPDPQDLDWVLVVLWVLIAARGLYKSLHILRRVTRERNRVRMKHGDDLELAIISRGNVRRHTLQALKLTAFLIIGLSILAGHSNTTVNRGLIVAILVLMWGGAEADDDEIDTFDRVYESQLDEGTSQ